MAARQEHVDAQANAGFMYTYGLGTRQDFGEAMDWLYRAALRGNPKAQLGMGSLYKNGWILYAMNRLLSTGIAWGRGLTGRLRCQLHNIPLHYGFLLGVPRNYEEALFWFQKAANLGNSSVSITSVICIAGARG